MKAEHRKELETNVLADQMGRMIQTIKHGPQKTTTMVWVFVLLALGTFAVWKYYANAKYVERSSTWVALDRIDAVSEAPAAVSGYKELAEAHHGTIPARTAQFQMARILLENGLQNLAADRTEAVRKVVEARQLYERLAQQCSDAPVLAQEALMGLARGEEALIGVANPGNPGQNYGSLERALETYRKLATKYPNSYLGKAAAERSKVLENPQAGDLNVTAFYTQLNELAAATSKPDAGPSLPPLPGVKPEAGPTLKPEAEPKSDTKPEAEPKSDTKPEAKGEPKSEAKPESKPEPKPEPKAQPEPKPEPKAQPEPKPEPKSDPKSQAKPETRSP